MKEATGELNMTVITLIAVAALGTLFYLVLYPMIQRMIVQQTCNTYGNDYVAEKVVSNQTASNGGAETSKWQCCPENQSGNKKCIPAD